MTIPFLVDKISARWEYTLAFVFVERGLSFQLFDDAELFGKEQGLKYQFSGDFGILMNENELFQGEIGVGQWQNQTVVTFDNHPDVLSSIFYILTRMEEYGNTLWDKHGRFEGVQSWQYKNNLLDKAVCDRWAELLIGFLEKELNVQLEHASKPGRIIPTFDIDNAFAFEYKSGKRKLLSTAKDIVQGNKIRRNERSNVLSGRVKDPYNSYQTIEQIAKTFPVHVFWLVGDYGKMDFNISIENPEIKKLVGRLSQNCSVGIHPSYRSNEERKLVKREVERLEVATDGKVKKSRQHFLKLRFPETFHGLVDLKIEEDFTMGFADQIGFRNGTARSFPWFDLSKNEPTSLIISPFVYMDGTLNEYLQLKPEEAKTVIAALFNEVKTYGGDFIFLWHNETITDYGIWKDWSQVLNFTLTLSNK